MLKGLFRCCPTASLIVLVGCRWLNPNSPSNDVCPNTDDTVSFSGYGTYKFRHSGSDSTARRIVSDCDWHVYQDHNGGIGDTLEVASPDEDVIMIWAYNDFERVILQKGWDGETDRGVRLGDSQERVLALYPELKPPYYTWQNGCMEFNPYFTENKLSELYIWGC